MKLMQTWLARLVERQDMALAGMMLVSIFMMIVPLPTSLVDMLIAVNLTFSVIILMIAIYIREPLEFSVFPSVLLIATLYRLALTISTSRLVLMQHDAGEIIYTFGSFAVGGNLAVGLIVFTIITVVQFIVITKGAERVAEVGARFSLDGMPGKQMSIDGDMQAGVIDAAEAKRQRERLQRESRLYGAMDGAMRFVKGDAIASIVVVLVNILGGIAIGVMQQGMSASEAVATYSILSVGDGLVAQIPALLISLAAGIIVTRVPGESKQHLAQEMMHQIGLQPRSLMVTSAVLVAFGLIPGFPMLDFLLIASGLLAIYTVLRRRGLRQSTQDATSIGAESNERGLGKLLPSAKVGAIPLMLRLSSELAQSSALMPALDHLRAQKFEQLGLPLGEIEIELDSTLPNGEMQVLLYRECVLTVQVPERMHLADAMNLQVSGATQVTPLPYSGLCLNWLDSATAAAYEATGGLVHRDEMRIVRCLSQAIDRHARDFIGVQETHYLMDAMNGRYAELVRELQRQMPTAKIADVLQRLIEEGVSIRDLRTIFEALIEWSPKEKDPIMLTEYARLALRRQITARHKHGHAIRVWRIGERIESLIRESVRQTSAGAYTALSPQQSKAILERIGKALQTAAPDGQIGVLLTSIDIRRFLRKLTERNWYALPVLSHQELSDETEMDVQGHIDLERDVHPATA